MTLNVKPYELRADCPAAPNDHGWQASSYPLGCGYFGASVYGGVGADLIQISENTLWTGSCGWLNNRLCSGNEVLGGVILSGADTFSDVENYERVLCMNDGTVRVSYTRKSDGVTFTRTYFTSYPDRVLVVRCRASVPGMINLTASLYPSYVRKQLYFAGDRCGKTGTSTAEGREILMQGEGEYYHTGYAGILSAEAFGEGATVEAAGGSLLIRGADEAVFRCTVATSYRLCPEIFLERDPEKKLACGIDPVAEVRKIMDAANARSYAELYDRHNADFGGKFGRVSLSLGGREDPVTTERLRIDYHYYQKDNRLHELMYQYGRYLLLSCSRKGGLPASLQGIWNCYEVAPWTSGFWYNINEQMNYWPAFPANLPEAFEAFADFNTARMPEMERIASEYVESLYPENHTEGQGADGWIVGTGNSAYSVGRPGGHSGPGTGGFTTLLYWDWYKFTGDTELLRREIFPVLQGMARFYSKCVRSYDGLWLVPVSSSPEQKSGGKYAQTIGCAFDQQMVECQQRHYVEAADLLGDDPIVDRALVEETRARLPFYDPVQVGADGQLKEYREETHYGDIGDPTHRHISHLLGLAPGDVVTKETPAWLDAARVALKRRGNEAGSWGLANRMLAWARLGDGDASMVAFDKLAGTCLYDNLWTNHDGGHEFQIDASFGICAAIGEMLLQSQGGAISLLPALPKEWDKGFFSGLVARGGYTVAVTWEQYTPTRASITATAEGICRVYARDPLSVTCGGEAVDATWENGVLSFPVQPEGIYELTGFRRHRKPDPVGGFVKKNDHLAWDRPEEGGFFTVLCARESAPGYEVLDDHVTFCRFPIPEEHCQRTFKILFTASDGETSCSAPLTLVPDGTL